MRIRTGACVAAAAMVVGAAGCGSGGGTAAPSTLSGTSAAQPSDHGLVVEISIAAGNVTPTNATLQATVNEPITLRVDSDAEDELHVHSVPDHEFAIEPKSGQSFEFTVGVPGSVEVELHHVNRTVATIQVRP